jgi:hypothetical protein
VKKSSPSLISAVFLGLFSLVLVHSDEAQKAAWKGKVETENGMRVVYNPKVSLHGDVKLDLAEDLSVGKEGDPNLQFYGVRDVAVDSQGNIYVVDMKNYRVNLYVCDLGNRRVQIDDRSGKTEMPPKSPKSPKFLT